MFIVIVTGTEIEPTEDPASINELNNEQSSVEEFEATHEDVATGEHPQEISIAFAILSANDDIQDESVHEPTDIQDAGTENVSEPNPQEQHDAIDEIVAESKGLIQ